MTLRIALQKNGRMTTPSLDWLEACGLRFERNTQSLITKCDNADVELLLVRNQDIPQYVYRGAADFGIVGENVLLETAIPLCTIESLDFGKCQLVLAIPEMTPIKNLSDLEGLRVATSYPNTLRQFSESKKLNCSIIPIGGSVEVAPKLNLAEAVCDLSQSGQTLRENGLRPLCVLLESQAVLVGRKQSSFLNSIFKTNSCEI